MTTSYFMYQSYHGSLLYQ